MNFVANKKKRLIYISLSLVFGFAVLALFPLFNSRTSIFANAPGISATVSLSGVNSGTIDYVTGSGFVPDTSVDIGASDGPNPPAITSCMTDTGGNLNTDGNSCWFYVPLVLSINTNALTLYPVNIIGRYSGSSTWGPTCGASTVVIQNCTLFNFSTLDITDSNYNKANGNQNTEANFNPGEQMDLVILGCNDKLGNDDNANYYLTYPWGSGYARADGSAHASVLFTIPSNEPLGDYQIKFTSSQWAILPGCPTSENYVQFKVVAPGSTPTPITPPPATATPTQTGPTPIGSTSIQSPLGTNDWQGFITNIIKGVSFLFYFVVGVAVLAMIIYAGYLYIVAGDNEESVAKARKILIYVAIGVLVIALINVILGVLNNIFGINIGFTFLF